MSIALIFNLFKINLFSIKECDIKPYCLVAEEGKNFPQSWVLNILKRENTIPTNEEIIRHNICNVELQSSICDF